MDDFARLILLLVLAGAALTALGSAAIWFMDEERRLRRAFRKVLGARPEALVIAARGVGRGAGFCFSRNQMAVAWDSGAWCLIYKIDEMMGAELVVDGVVVGRAYRGEQRRPLDEVASEASRVTLRLVFDDPHHADFDLDLWLPGEAARKGGLAPSEAIEEANRWLSRVEAILRRPLSRRPAPPPASAAAVAAPLPPPADPEDDNPPRPPAARREEPAKVPASAQGNADDEEEGPPF